MAGQTGVIDILRLVTGVATQPGHTHAAVAPAQVRNMRVAVVALQRAIAGRMTVHAARMRQDFAGLFEQHARTFGLVRNALERARRLEAVALLRRASGLRTRAQCRTRVAPPST
jgi:hypothetical protein